MNSNKNVINFFDKNIYLCLALPMCGILKTAKYRKEKVMGNEAGEWIIHGVTWDDPVRDPWRWRIAIAKKHDVLYGKFFAKKAGFISKKWLPVFANYRRDGYDFDALFEDEKAPIKHKNIMDHFMENDAEIYSYELKKLAGFGKDGEKGFDGAITSLMMQTYLCNCDFRKRINQKGVEYGWDVAVYSSPEHIYGYDHVTSCYKEDPRTSWGKIVDHMKQLYPEAADTQIRKILK